MDEPRGAKAQADIVFVRRSIQERAALRYAEGDDGDYSDGWTTSSSIEARMDALEGWERVAFREPSD